jgi:hypothetical protein
VRAREGAQCTSIGVWVAGVLLCRCSSQLRRSSRRPSGCTTRSAAAPCRTFLCPRTDSHALESEEGADGGKEGKGTVGLRSGSHLHKHSIFYREFCLVAQKLRIEGG